MDVLGRLLLRFILVPLGVAVAAVVAAAFVIIGHWDTIFVGHADPPLQLVKFAAMMFLLLHVIFVFGFVLFVVPAAIGILVSETFAIRSWMFHAANGGLSACVVLGVTQGIRDHGLHTEPMIVVAAGLAAGFVYWIMAGWTAGFWKPIGESPWRPEPPSS